MGACLSLQSALFGKYAFPCYRNPPLKESKEDKEISGGWANVKVYKRQENGRFYRTLHTYTLDVASGDLYGIDPDSLKSHQVASKCLAIFFAVPFYALGLVACNVAKLIADVTSIFWRVIPEMIHDLLNKSVLEAAANALMAIVFTVPNAINGDIRRIASSPFFAMGMLFASAVGVFHPHVGRKWLGRIELCWHENMSNHHDLRHSMSQKEWEELTPFDYLHYGLRGKILYLSYCMAVRGNISEKIEDGRDKFVFKKEKEHKGRLS